MVYLFFPEPPPPAASRSLIMIAKCLQNLANLVRLYLKAATTLVDLLFY